jgi:hypothetical protein
MGARGVSALLRLGVVCPVCSAATGFLKKIQWRIGMLEACPACGAAWKLDRHLIWGVTSTLAGVAGLVGWVLGGTIGLTVVGLATFVMCELLLLPFLQPARDGRTPGDRLHT